MIKDYGCNGRKNSNDERQQRVLKVMVGCWGARVQPKIFFYATRDD
jgi:hypothetical protein